MEANYGKAIKLSRRPFVSHQVDPCGTYTWWPRLQAPDSPSHPICLSGATTPVVRRYSLGGHPVTLLLLTLFYS